jgi:hypothetical protein
MKKFWNTLLTATEEEIMGAFILGSVLTFLGLFFYNYLNQ